MITMITSLRTILKQVLRALILMVTCSAIVEAQGTNVQVQLVTLFDSNGPIGPEAGLVQDSSGAFYGTTKFGGPYFDTGSVFKITPDGVVDTLVFFDNYAFYPVTGLTQISNGLFVGTTEGTIFKIDSMGDFSNVFTLNYDTNGTQPMGDLLFSKDGNLYGSTYYSGSGNGTLFKMTLSGGFTTLVNFDYTNGGGPNGRLLEADDGCLYGETSRGGSNGWGTIFKYDGSAGLATLYSFTDGDDGSYPSGGLIQTTNGDFYGVTASGGQFGEGTVFQFRTNAGLTTLISFDGTNGSYPQARLIQGSDGAFYGTTLAGAAFNAGTVFRIDAFGNLTTLGVFDGTNANASYAGLIMAQDGNLYGTTSGGGFHDSGTVFRLVTPPSVTVVNSAGQSTTLTWNSFPGAHYRVDGTSSVNSTWAPFTNFISAGAYTSLAITHSGLEQFYRVVLLPW
ncbi:MAG TPA: choice-of-anchor tandem repeat GloVer-containing protein [Verrucomicrobiae bacterium]|jgi:uncharacterized repeat protein (TIGR03803 family)|nr:choice-of-anchor tandem repeat GloVer-containing protein [Verrucomicrobiae bacterium]